MTSEVDKNQRYKVISKLGIGSMGTVYKVRDELLDKIVALKVIGSDTGPSGQPPEAEFDAIRKLRHPNIVEVYDLGTTHSGNWFFTMEYIEGLNLKKQFEKVDLPAFQSIAVQICDALNFIHSRGYIHSDLKPANILIAKDEIGLSSKLMDFGLISAAHGSNDETIKGTLSYLAPEVLEGKPYDKRMDLYSLGVTFYEVLTHELPSSNKPMDMCFLSSEVTEPLAHIIQKLLEKNPDARYQSAGEVIFDLQSVGNSKAIDNRTMKFQLPGGAFVGREKELAILAKSLERLKRVETKSENVEATEPSPSFIIISGEAGVGKSRLSGEFKYHVQSNDIAFYSSYCHEGDSTPFGPLKQILKPIILNLSSFAEERRLIKKYAGDLFHLLPELKEMDDLESISPSITLEADQEKLRIFEKLTGFFSEITEKQPSVLFFEDIHWADELSLEFLEYFARSMPKETMITCCTYRTEEMLMGHHLNELKKELEEYNWYKEIQLQRFSKRDVIKLLASMLGNGTTEMDFLSERIFDETEGNPLFINGVMSLLVDEGIIYRKGEKWDVEIKEFEKLDIPENISNVIKRRLEGIDETYRSILQLASIIGRSFHVETLQAINGEFGELELRNKLDQLQRLQIIVSDPNDDNLLSFSHEKIREVVYDEISVKNKQRLHEKMGMVLEKRHEENLNSVINQLAYHFSRCSNKTRALDYLLQAGDSAKKLFANKRAIEYYESCLQLIEDEGKRFEIIKKLANIYHLIGDYENSLKYYRKALMIYFPLAKTRKDATDIFKLLDKEDLSDFGSTERESIAELLNSIGSVQCGLGEYHEGIKYFEKSQWLIKDIGYTQTMVKALNNTGFAYNRLGEFYKTIKYCGESLKIAEKIQDKKGIVYALDLIGWASRSLGRYESAIESFRKSLTISKKSGDKVRIATTYSSLGMVHFYLGNYRAATRHFVVSLQMSERIGYVRRIVQSLTNLGVLNTILGNFDKAIEYYGKSLAINEKTGEKQEKAKTLINIGTIYHNKGNYSKATSCLEKALRINEKLGNEEVKAICLCDLGLVYEATGEWQNALKLLKNALKIAKKSGLKDHLATICSALAVVLVHLNRIRLATEYARMALELGEDINSKPEQGNAHRTLAVIQSGTESDEVIEKHFRKSIQLFKELGDKYELGRANLDFGVYYFQNEKYAESLRYLLEAENIFVQLESRHQLARTYFRKGLCLSGLGDFPESFEHLSKSRSILKELNLYSELKGVNHHILRMAALLKK